MLYRVSLGLVCLALFSVPLAVAQQSPDDQGLMQVEHEWGGALKQQDTAALGRILADDFFYTDADGRVLNKAQYIERAAHMRIDAYSFEDAKTHLYGETGVVTSHFSGKGTYGSGSKRSTFDVRSTDVFVKREGHWQVVVSQDTHRAKK